MVYSAVLDNEVSKWKSNNDACRVRIDGLWSVDSSICIEFDL